jgi:hypothetical protein
MFGAPTPLRRSKTQHLFLLSAGFLSERLPVVVSHNEARLLSSADHSGGKRRSGLWPICRWRPRWPMRARGGMDRFSIFAAIRRASSQSPRLTAA